MALEKRISRDAKLKNESAVSKSESMARTASLSPAREV